MCNIHAMNGVHGLKLRLYQLNRLYCRYWQRLPNEVQPLPDGPLILVGNHRSGVDPLLVQASVNRPLHFLMAREYYQAMWYMRWLFDMSGAIPVHPGGANRQALAAAVTALHKGCALCLFPEGEANPPVPLQRILPGAVVLALETGAPLIPFAVTGVWPFDHVHMWRPFLRRGRARIRFGEPLRLQRGKVDKHAIRHHAAAIRQAINALL